MNSSQGMLRDSPAFLLQNISAAKSSLFPLFKKYVFIKLIIIIIIITKRNIIKIIKLLKNKYIFTNGK